ncbi:MATE family efflux transporter [Christensenella tenuis]|uniref:MATE family efflux transporter n=1 Tax=Christensenella tenuis TaxID=2763033 RepID=A0ABR7EAK6_9FIRM|nr:MATE family efflux transporter [Christensenella tenuis]MBC5646826.1 MATE family efflux transporter [Christensenella tenuis]
MQNQPSENQFFRYVLPSMLAMLLSGFYAIIDGFFVGHTIGDTGLASINIAWPIASFLLAAGTGIGAGGSVVMTTRLGEGKLKKSRKALGNTLFVLIAFSAVMTILLLLFYRPLLQFLGAEGNLLTAAAEYTQIIALGSACQILGTGLVPLLRNKGKTISAMIAMVCGLITNIILDALFMMVFRWGMFGAAFATVTAQALVAVLSLILLFRKRKERPEKRDLLPHGQTVARLLKIGLSPFGMTFAPSIIIILANWQCLAYGGSTVVAAYAVLMYFVTSAQLLLQGIGEGIQPLLSYFNGAGKPNSVHRLLKKSFALVLALGGILCAGAIIFRDAIPAIFGASGETSFLVASALLISAFSFPMTGVTRLASSFFYAVQKTGYSTLVIYIDPLALTPFFLYLLPVFWGVTGIWLSIPVAQGALVCITGILFIIYFRKHGASAHCCQNTGGTNR